MPLHINLYHEIEKLHEQRKRDPLKISLFILGGVVAIFAAMYALELAKFASVDSDYRKMKSEFDAIDPTAKKAVAREASLQKTVAAGNTLVRRIEGRFYWAPVLEQLATLVPREVQITKLDGRVQGTGLKKIEITIDGVTSGAEPRKVAEDLRTSLEGNFGKQYKSVTASFRQLEESPERVTLDAKEWPTAIFVINLQFQFGEETPATPPPRKRGKK
jgi:Tfp pilus assembly protein PilN